MTKCIFLPVQEGNHPIHDATHYNHIETVKLLVEKYHVDPMAANLQVLCMYTTNSYSAFRCCRVVYNQFISVHSLDIGNSLLSCVINMGQIQWLLNL